MLLDGLATATAVERSMKFICDKVQAPAELYIQLVSSGILNDDMEAQELDKLNIEANKMTETLKVLRKVKAVITKSPGKFDKLCSAFEEMGLSKCSDKLKGMIHKVMASFSAILYSYCIVLEI